MQRGWKIGIGAGLLALATACVVGGQEADPADWPGMASLQALQGRSVFHECGATMISPEWALRATDVQSSIFRMQPVARWSGLGQSGWP